MDYDPFKGDKELFSSEVKALAVDFSARRCICYVWYIVKAAYVVLILAGYLISLFLFIAIKYANFLNSFDLT